MNGRLMKDGMNLDRKEKSIIQLYLSYLVLLNVLGEDTTKALLDKLGDFIDFHKV
jgi:hypothetical protein